MSNAARVIAKLKLRNLEGMPFRAATVRERMCSRRGTKEFETQGTEETEKDATAEIGILDSEVTRLRWF